MSQDGGKTCRLIRRQFCKAAPRASSACRGWVCRPPGWQTRSTLRGRADPSPPPPPPPAPALLVRSEGPAHFRVPRAGARMAAGKRAAAGPRSPGAMAQWKKKKGLRKRRGAVSQGRDSDSEDGEFEIQAEDDARARQVRARGPNARAASVSPGGARRIRRREDGAGSHGVCRIPGCRRARLAALRPVGLPAGLGSRALIGYPASQGPSSNGKCANGKVWFGEFGAFLSRQPRGDARPRTRRL